MGPSFVNMDPMARTGLLLTLFIVVGACRSDSTPSLERDYVRALRVMKRVTSPRQLRRSGFMGRPVEQRSPSHWVQWYFSPLGAGEWPVVEGSIEDAPDMPGPKLPATVALVAAEAQAEQGRQLVLRGDDATWELIAEVVPDPSVPAIETVRWPFPRFSPPM